MPLLSILEILAAVAAGSPSVKLPPSFWANEPLPALEPSPCAYCGFMAAAGSRCTSCGAPSPAL